MSNTKVEVSVVLHPTVLSKIEQQCKPVDVGTQTTDLQAAFILGQQSVIQLLRKHYVVD